MNPLKKNLQINLLLACVVAWMSASAAGERAGETALSAPAVAGASHPADADLLQHIKRVWPAVRSLHREDIARPYFSLYADRSARRRVGWAFTTSNWAPEVKGYNGPVDVLCILDSDGVIKAVDIVSHLETPSIASGIEEEKWLAGFRGFSLEKPPIWPGGIDGVSGATVSSRAVCDSVTISLKRLKTVLSGASTD